MTYSKSMKKIVACIVALLIAVAYMPAATQGAYAADGATQISTAQGLKDMLHDVNEGTGDAAYELTADIDLGEDGLGGSIGAQGFPFMGTFDGNGHVITGLKAPLFGFVNGATLKNFAVDGVIEQQENNMAAVVTRVLGGSTEAPAVTTIECVGNYADVTSTVTGGTGNGVAGIVGLINNYANVTITEAFNKGDISGYQCTGGIVGRMEANSTLTVESSYNTGDVNARNNYEAGIVGRNQAAAAACTITGCYNTGDTDDPISRDAATEDGNCWLVENKSDPAVDGEYTAVEFADGTVQDVLNEGAPGTWVPGITLEADGDIPGDPSASPAVEPVIGDTQFSPGLSWEPARDLSITKLAANNILAAYKEDAQYRETQAGYVEDAKDAGKAAIDAATDNAAVVDALDDALFAVSVIPEKKDVEDAVDDLEAYRSGAGLYNEPQAIERAAIVEEGVAAIRAAATVDELTAIKDEKKDAIFALPTVKTFADVEDFLKSRYDYSGDAGKYRDTQQPIVVETVDAWIEKIIAEGTTKVGIWGTYDAKEGKHEGGMIQDAVAELDAIPTAEAFQDALADANSFFEAIEDGQKEDPPLYSDAQWPEIAEAISTAKEAIYLADNANDYDALVSAIEAVKFQVSLHPDKYDVAEANYAKKALRRAINTAKNIVKPEQYTADSLANLSWAISVGAFVMELEETFPEAVRAAQDLVEQAQYDLELKVANTMTVTKKNKTVKYAKVKKKKQVVKAVYVKNAVGKVTYKKASGKAYFTVNSKTGKITIKKGTKKGKYTVKVKVTAAGNGDFKSKTKTVSVKITIK